MHDLKLVHCHYCHFHNIPKLKPNFISLDQFWVVFGLNSSKVYRDFYFKLSLANQLSVITDAFLKFMIATKSLSLFQYLDEWAGLLSLAHIYAS